MRNTRCLAAAAVAAAMFARLPPSALADPPACTAPAACEEVVVGALFPQTGSAARAASRAATRLAVDDVNRDANVLPHTHLVLLEADLDPLRGAASDTSRQVAAADAVRVLEDAGAVAAVGAPYSSDVFALEGELAATSIPLMGFSATHADLSALPHFARVVPPDSLQAVALADLALDRDWARLGIVRCADSYCRGLTAGLRQELSARGLGHRVDLELEMASTGTVIGNLTREFGSDPCVFESHKQSAVFLILHADEAEQLLVELSARGDVNLPVRLVGADGVEHSAAAVAMHMFSVRSAVMLERGHERVARMINQTDISIIWPHLAYDAVWALAHAMDAAHASGGGSAALSNATAIMHAVRSVSFEGVTSQVTFDSAGDRRGGFFASYISDVPGEEEHQTGIWNRADGSYPGLRHNQLIRCDQVVVISHLAVDNTPKFDDDARATQQAIADINADSDLLSRVQLRLVHSSIRDVHHLKDDLARQEAAEAAVVLSVEGGAIAALGSPFSSHVKLLSQPLLHDAAIPLVGYRSTASVLSDDQMYPHFARVCPPDSLQVKALVEIVLNQGWTNFGIIHCEDAYCTGLADNFKQQMSSHGIVIDSQQEKELLSDSNAGENGNAGEVVDWMELTFDGSCTSEEVVTVMLLLHTSETEALFEVLHQRDEEGSSNLAVRFLGADGVGSANTAGASSGLVCMLPYVNHAATLGSAHGSESEPFDSVVLLRSCRPCACCHPLCSFDVGQGCDTLRKLERRNPQSLAAVCVRFDVGVSIRHRRCDSGRR